jgi:glycosyltransferase involved in cell wall biosynthesis
VIPNAIDFQSLSQIDRNVPVKPHSIISTGRLYWVKGFGLLVQAVNSLKDEFPDVQLQIFGNGTYRTKLDELVTKLGLQENVKITSHIPRAELWNKIVEASIGVQASLHEAQSVSMLEAMALIKPMIAFNYPFAQEVIHEGYNGLLAQPKNVEDLADKIRVLFADEALRKQMGQNAFNYVSERHNWKVLIDKYLTMYEQAISAHSA